MNTLESLIIKILKPVIEKRGKITFTDALDSLRERGYTPSSLGFDRGELSNFLAREFTQTRNANNTRTWFEMKPQADTLNDSQKLEKILEVLKAETIRADDAADAAANSDNRRKEAAAHSRAMTTHRLFLKVKSIAGS